MHEKLSTILLLTPVQVRVLVGNIIGLIFLFIVGVIFLAVFKWAWNFIRGKGGRP